MRLTARMALAIIQSKLCMVLTLSIVAGTILFPFNSQANLFEHDFLLIGDGLLTYDDDTGLEWLDLTYSDTLGLSYFEIIQNWIGPGDSLEAFRYADPSTM